MKLGDDSLERFRASGLGAAAAVPAVPSILPLPLMEGPADPAERVEAIRAAVRRLAPFEPECVLFLTGPGDDRETIVEGIRAIGEEGSAQGVPVALEPTQREFAHFWSVASSLAEAQDLIDEAGADVGPDVRHVAALERAARPRSRRIATGSAASTSPTGASRPGTRTTACCLVTAWSTSARSSRLSAGTASTTSRSSRTPSCDGSLWREDPRELAARGVQQLRRVVSTASA